jgi:hypothetical protein
LSLFPDDIRSYFRPRQAAEDPARLDTTGRHLA